MKQSKPFYVSDHALVRYLERVHGIPVEEIKQHMLTGGVVEGIKAGAKVVIVEGVRFIIEKGLVATVWAEGEAAENRRVKDLNHYNSSKGDNT